MADAAKKNFNLDVVRAGIAALEIERRERRSWGEVGESFGVIHNKSIVSTDPKNFHRLIKTAPAKRRRKICPARSSASFALGNNFRLNLFLAVCGCFYLIRINMPDCFIIMPITTPELFVPLYSGDKLHFHHVLEHLFIPALEKNKFNPIRPIAEGSDVIHAEIIKNLEKADLVLCDASCLNPNVFYELGIRTALDKPVCIVKDEITQKIPFDIPTELIDYGNKLGVSIRSVSIEGDGTILISLKSPSTVDKLVKIKEFCFERGLHPILVPSRG